MLEWIRKRYDWCALKPRESKYKLSYAFKNVSRSIAKFPFEYGILDESDGEFNTITYVDLHALAVYL